MFLKAKEKILKLRETQYEVTKVLQDLRKEFDDIIIAQPPNFNNFTTDQNGNIILQAEEKESIITNNNGKSTTRSKPKSIK